MSPNSLRQKRLKNSTGCKHNMAGAPDADHHAARPRRIVSVNGPNGRLRRGGRLHAAAARSGPRPGSGKVRMTRGERVFFWVREMKGDSLMGPSALPMQRRGRRQVLACLALVTCFAPTSFPLKRRQVCTANPACQIEKLESRASHGLRCRSINPRLVGSTTARPTSKRRGNNLNDFKYFLYLALFISLPFFFRSFSLFLPLSLSPVLSPSPSLCPFLFLCLSLSVTLSLPLSLFLSFSLPLLLPLFLTLRFVAGVGGDVAGDFATPSTGTL